MAKEAKKVDFPELFSPVSSVKGFTGIVCLLTKDRIFSMISSNRMLLCLENKQAYPFCGSSEGRKLYSKSVAFV